MMFLGVCDACEDEGDVFPGEVQVRQQDAGNTRYSAHPPMAFASAGQRTASSA
jgi:hypothetical protein